MAGRTNAVVITGGGGGVLGTKNILSNGIYQATNDGYDGYSRVTVNVEDNPIKFYDPYGNLVTSYTIAEAQALTSLPDAPTLDNLTFQEWNYTLAQVNAFDRAMNVGATYKTTSGKTEIDIVLTAVTGLVVTLQNLTGMTSIDWGDGTTNSLLTHTYASIGGYTIKIAGATSLGQYMFTQSSSAKNYYCKKMRLADSVTTIGNNAFRYCYSLSHIVIPNSVTSIVGAFRDCTLLSSVIIPNGVTSINDEVFKNCYSLSHIVIPNGVTSIKSYAFYNCYSLTSVTIPNSVTSIGAYAFQYCSALSNIVIPNSVTSISSSVFEGCYSLSSVAMSNRVTSIASSFFRNCYSLSNIVIPNSVTSISNYAFYNCYSLTSVTIPNSVTSIGAYAFYTCTSILEYNFSNYTSVPSLVSVDAFTGINGICQIKVPLALETQWKAATNWITYANYIVGVQVI